MGPLEAPALPREPEVDGLRAVAATMVLLFHCLSAVAAPDAVDSSLRLGWPGAVANGNSAVVLFFVLSGYVLTGSFLREPSASGAGAFLVRRAFRLYPAYLAGLVLAWLVSLLVPLFEHGAGESAWLRAHGQLQLDGARLLLSALAPGAAYDLIPVGWTLRLELLYSLAFPLLMLVALRLHVGVLVVATAVSLIVTPSRLLNYAFPFTVGMAMYLHRDRLRALPVPGGIMRWLLLLVVGAAFLLPPFHLWPHSRLLGMTISTLGAAGLAWLAGHAPLAPLLRSSAMTRAGEISYSLYLLHVPVVMLISPLVLADAPAPDFTAAVARWLTIAALVLPTTLAAAALVYRWIEAPGIRMGRRLGAR